MKKLLMVIPLVFLLCFTFSCQQGEDVITEEEAKLLLDRYVEVWNDGNLALLDEIMAPDIVKHEYGLPEKLVGIDAIKKDIINNRTAFPDLHITIDRIIIKDDMMVSVWTYTGTNTGLFWDLPATGKKVRLPGVTITRIASGKQVEMWSYYNDLDMLIQLGFTITPPAPPEPEEKK